MQFKLLRQICGKPHDVLHLLLYIAILRTFTTTVYNVNLQKFENTAKPFDTAIVMRALLVRGTFVRLLTWISKLKISSLWLPHQIAIC